MKNRILGKEKYIQVLKEAGIDVQKYMSPIFGFDISKFDEDSKVPEGMSCAEFVEKKYGLNVANAMSKLF